MSTFICRECDEEISINDGLDPADYCNACVHTVVDKLQSKLTTLLEAAEAASANDQDDDSPLRAAVKKAREGM